MKKILFAVAIILGMTLAASCGNRQAKEVAEEEVVEVVDSVEAPCDTLVVAE